ncbi:MAG TPA: DUF433 domain-containing protein [Pirellulales bacterium]|jgi:uncharacterized protein (DUF433 family)|nr:DUF433 domain-containing protein [Pirellulales bacterium]
MLTATNRSTRRAHPDGIEACIRDTNINVWGLVAWRQLGRTDAEIVDSIVGRPLDDLAAAWDYYVEHRDEIDGFIHRNEEA